MVIDQEQRLTALDPAQSFIVQAPAGSGKTELLTQRFLVLLSLVNTAPEEVVAITFTRKAASEMRERILHALQAALKEDPPEEPHALQTWQFATQVLARDKIANWCLLKNPNRLRILTIDALCAQIVKSAPLASQFGLMPSIVEDPHFIYLEAAQRLLASLDENFSWTKPLQRLLLHLDNNYLFAQELFIGMLSHRDQWLDHVISHKKAENPRLVLEAALTNVIQSTLTRVGRLFNNADKQELLALLKFASNLIEDDSPIGQCSSITIFPATKLEDLTAWQGIANLLLTQSFEWRRTVNKNIGFPPASAALNQEEKILFQTYKERMCRFLERMSDNELLRSTLKEIQLLPPPAYTDQQWKIVNVLIELLPILVAQLNILFHEKNVTDFIAIAKGAILALGDIDNPSDVALNLDYKIQHLLVDEFQDTSVTQYQLFKLLTAGWQKNDGRTLFLVGDPMQSIYRFREAEVGIFLKVKKYGLGNVRPIPLTLTVNFRSSSAVINWFNDAFKTIFPSLENIELGAIPFSASTALKDDINADVKVHTFVDSTEEEVATELINLIKAEINVHNSDSIAVLVRSRSHLQAIISELKKASIDFQAIEIAKLSNSPTVGDLLALTKALSHTGNTIAWLAILRAPWCGLSLADLWVIANHNRQNTIFESLKQTAAMTTLSEDGRFRISRILPILTEAIDERSRANLRHYITYTWYKLGGPACLAEEYELKDAESFLNLLTEFTDIAAVDFNYLEKKLASAYSQVDSPTAKVHLMTIHKAKGLEFDVVFLPALEKRPKLDEGRLLLSLERQTEHENPDLILAPIRSQEADHDPIYRYIRTQNALKADYETARLLYVAVTRAKQRLHLVSSIFHSEKEPTEIKKPSVSSFLHLLWPSIQNNFVQNTLVQNNLEESSESFVFPSSPLQRLTLDWQLSTVLPTVEADQKVSVNRFEWSTEYLPQVGTVIHRFFQDYCNWSQLDNPLLCKRRVREDFLTNPPASLTLVDPLFQSGYFNDESSIAPAIVLEQLSPLLQKRLLQLGVLERDLKRSLYLVEKAISNTLNDPRGQWILSPSHSEAQNEYPMSVNIENKIVHYIIDRTFIDENGIRWIIDYKNTELLEAEQNFEVKVKTRYAQQLENYAKVMKLLDNKPIKLGVYFPLWQGWCEWDFDI